MRTNIAVIIFILIGACVLIFVCNKNGEDLKKNGILTTGIVKSVYEGGRGGINVDYEFEVNGKKLNGSQFYFISAKFMNEFKNRSFPVIFSSKNPSRNVMLIVKSNFDDYRISYPDSMRWISNLRSL